MTFAAGDKVRQVDWYGPRVKGDEFIVLSIDPTYVYVCDSAGAGYGGYRHERFMKVADVEPELPQVWQDKIEAALGRDALVTLGVVAAPEPKFKVGDRVSYANDGLGNKGTVIEVNPVDVRVQWDDDVILSHYEKFLRLVEVVKTQKTGIQVQVHIEGGDHAEGRAQNVARVVERILKGHAYPRRGKVTTDIYTYTETTEA